MLYDGAMCRPHRAADTEVCPGPCENWRWRTWVSEDPRAAGTDHFEDAMEMLESDARETYATTVDEI